MDSTDDIGNFPLKDSSNTNRRIRVVIHENPVFVPPDELLRELRERRGSGLIALSVKDS